MSDTELQRAARAFARLVDTMRTLRLPGGCPWDREQTMSSLRRYTIEEAYEVVQAIDDHDLDALRSELGDLLLQVVFLSQIAAEQRAFDVAAVADGICDKLVRRHPHVFAGVEVRDAQEVVRNWEAIKHRERGGGSVLDDVPRSLPALERAQKLGKRASQLRFDWADATEVLGKVHEELQELEAVVRQGEDAARQEEELGDLLLSLANLARHLGVSAEVALNRAGGKFERRFRQLERAVAQGRVPAQPGPMERFWEHLKDRESC